MNIILKNFYSHTLKPPIKLFTNFKYFNLYNERYK